MYLDAAQALPADAELLRDAHRGPRAQAGRRRRPRDQGRQIPRPAARHSVGREGSLRDQGHQDDVGRRAVRRSGHRLRRDRSSSGCATPARCSSPSSRSARSRRATVVRRADEAIRGIRSARIERLVGRPGLGDGRRLRRLLRSAPRRAARSSRRRRVNGVVGPAPDLRPREPLRRDGALDDDGQDRAAVPVRRGRRARVQRDLRAGQARRQRRRRGVPLESGCAARRASRSRYVEDRVRQRRAAGGGGGAAARRRRAAAARRATPRAAGRPTQQQTARATRRRSTTTCSRRTAKLGAKLEPSRCRPRSLRSPTRSGFILDVESAASFDDIDAVGRHQPARRTRTARAAPGRTRSGRRDSCRPSSTSARCARARCSCASPTTSCRSTTRCSSPAPAARCGMTNLTGHPAMARQVRLHRTALPRPRLMITGKLYDEATIARVALAYEQATEWKDKHPTLA